MVTSVSAEALRPTGPAAAEASPPILTLLLLPLPFAELTLDLLLDWFPLLALELAELVALPLLAEPRAPRGGR